MRAERGHDRSDALVASVSATIRDVTAELLARAPRDPGLIRRLQEMVDDVFTHWDALAREAESARHEADEAVEGARAAVEDAEVRLNDYVAACEAHREADMARVEAECGERIEAMRSEAEAADASASERIATLSSEREALVHALTTMTDVVHAAVEEDAAEAIRAAHTFREAAAAHGAH